MMIDNGKGDGEQLAAAGTEGGRRPTGVPAAPDSKIFPDADPIRLNGRGPQSNPQVVESPIRRRFTKAYKRDILEQIAACTKDGEVGQILRREGLYSSIVSTWRQKDKQGRLDAKASTKRVVKPAVQNALMPQLQRENARLKARLQQAELILEIQKKASEILGISLKTLDNERID
jgi:transposase